MHLQLPVSAVLEAQLRVAAQRLGAISGQPRDEAEWLLAELLGIERSRLRFWDAPLAAPVQARYLDWLAQRAAGKPFAYITGTQPFRRLMLHVTPDVLIPRADTEHLVDWALQVLAHRAQGAPLQPHAHLGASLGRDKPAPQKPKPWRVLDVCTGSGCVALALADEAPAHSYTASDCSAPALALARANAEHLQLPVRFIKADALALPADTPPFQLITANPPYIAEHDPHLPALHHEPTLALVSGADGLVLLRRLIADAPQWLVDGGWLLLEHGYDQGERVRELLTAQRFTKVETRRDYGGNERVTGGQWITAHD